MAYTKPAHTKSQVRKAGEIISGRVEGDAVIADSILTNWRAAHSCPLQALRMTVDNKAKRADPSAITVQRLKRWSSIVSKLERFSNMKLDTMQDIGGCRAIVRDPGALTRLLDSYIKWPLETFNLVKAYNYASDPKPDGYRSIHLIYAYAPKKVERFAFEGLRIEIQLRTRLQHAWATAVEVVSTFTDQNLKSGIGDENWKRFFFLASNLLAHLEAADYFKKQLGFSGIDDEMSELINLWDQLEVSHLLYGFAKSMSSPPRVPNADHLILKLNARQREVDIRGFTKQQSQAAIGVYNLLERQFRDDPAIQVVLVKVDKLTNLQKAYPNYYLDTSEFIAKMTQGIEIWNKKVEADHGKTDSRNEE